MFQSTRPARDATVLVNFKPCLVIRFNPRAPRGTRHAMSLSVQPKNTFQSTRPARDATCPDLRLPGHARRFNPRAPRGTRHRIWSGRSWPVRVSIHAPRAGRDIRVNDQPTLDAAFQSTRPARDAT